MIHHQDERALFLKLFDQFERRGATPPGMERERTPHLIRELPNSGPYWIVWSNLADLTSKEVDELLQEERMHAEALGRVVEWKHFEHDPPEDLLGRLVAAGFTPEDPETLLIMPLSAAVHPSARDGGTGGLDGRATNSELKVVHLGKDDLAEMKAVHQVVWPNHADRVQTFVGALLERDPNAADVVVGLVGGTPVSAGWSTFLQDSPFVGLWGGATIPEARGKGFYRAVVRERMAEAVRRGRAYAYVDAADTSRPILQQIGFTAVTTTTPCLYPNPSAHKNDGAHQ